MYRTNVRYKSFTGSDVSRQICIHLNNRDKRKLAEKYGGIENYGKKVTEMFKTKDNLAIMDFVDDIIRYGYCFIGDDGDTITKPSNEQIESFLCSNAYDAFIEKALGSEKEAIAFMEGATNSQYNKFDKNDPNVIAALKKAGIDPNDADAVFGHSDNSEKNDSGIIDAEVSENNASNAAKPLPTYGAEPVPDEDDAKELVALEKRIAEIRSKAASKSAETRVLAPGVKVY